MSITNDGKSAEDRFCELTGAVIDHQDGGDALLFNSRVEVKEASGGTINQIRPIHGWPIVARHMKSDIETWAVWSIVDLATLALTKAPQHASSSFRCMNLNMTQAIKSRPIKPTNLKTEIEKAIVVSQNNPEMISHLKRIRSEEDALFEKHKQQIKGYLSGH